MRRSAVDQRVERDTQPVMVSIRQGGGPCVEAPPARIGQLTWTRTIVTRPGEPAGSEREEGYAPAEEGNLVRETREPPLGDGPRLLPLLPTDEFSVIVRVLPRAGTLFSASGLTLFGRHEWVYEYHVLGLKLRQQAQ